MQGSSPLFPDASGEFGHKRRYDTHTGVDLYCELGQRIVACEDGVVVGIPWFTGSNAPNESGSPSDWWNDTKAVLIEGKSGVITYGEIGPQQISVSVGDEVKAGDFIGVVETPVLKSFKGRPNVMLHLELLRTGERENPWWTETVPPGLLDPTEHLKQSAPGAPAFDLALYDGVMFADHSLPRMPSRWWKEWGGTP